MAQATLIKIEYTNGATKEIRTNKMADHYTLVHVTGRCSRINAVRAKMDLEFFDHLCNEGQAKLVFMDEAAVARIRSR
jgi:hypothetical protein